MTARLVAGVDVGNATTEAAIACIEQGSEPRFIGTSLSLPGRSAGALCVEIRCAPGGPLSDRLAT